MSRKLLFVFIILQLLFTFSCATIKSDDKDKIITLTTPSNIDEIIVSPNYLKSYVGKKDLKIVLRVPKESRSVTTEDSQSAFYLDLEKRLMLNGFIIRDRALLDSLMLGQSSEIGYSSIYQKIDTDIILQIDSILLDGKIYPKSYMINGVSTVDQDNTKYSIEYAVIEARVVMVKEGEVGELIKIYALNTNDSGEVQYHITLEEQSRGLIGISGSEVKERIVAVFPEGNSNLYSQLIEKMISIILKGKI